MDGYVRMFDDLHTAEDDNPTIGLILCTEKNEAKADKMSENGVGKGGKMSGKRSSEVGKTSGKILAAIGNRGTIRSPDIPWRGRGGPLRQSDISG